MRNEIFGSNSVIFTFFFSLHHGTISKIKHTNKKTINPFEGQEKELIRRKGKKNFFPSQHQKMLLHAPVLNEIPPRRESHKAINSEQSPALSESHFQAALRASEWPLRKRFVQPLLASANL